MARLTIKLGKKKQVSVRKFNGVNLVDIREYYEDKATGELKPGKKVGFILESLLIEGNFFD